jgi:DNA-binding NarL/FixJ family response regulator
MIFDRLDTTRLPEITASPVRAPIILNMRDDGIGAEKVSSQGDVVLIVEDDFLIAMDLEAALTDAGYKVAAVAVTADEAIALAAAHAPTVVLMDIRLLGDRDGIDAALEIYRLYGVRSVFTSAHSDEESRRRADPAMPYGWIEKPYAVGTIVSFVQRLKGTT